MSSPNHTDIFYATVPVQRGFRSLMDAGAVHAAAGRLDGRHCRCRAIDQGDRREALQGGQHGGRRRDRGADQCARRPRISLRVRRRRRELRGFAARCRDCARGAGGDGGVGGLRAWAHFARRADSARRHSRARRRRAGGALRAVGESVLCDVLRRRARLGRWRGEARRVRRRPRRPAAVQTLARSHRPVVPLRGIPRRAGRDPVADRAADARRRSGRPFAR